MNPSEFNSQYLNEPVIDPRESILHGLAEEYHQCTESYDRTVCALRNPAGIAVPANSRESSLINRHATRILEAISEREGVSIQELRQAISRNFVRHVREAK